MSYPLWLFVNAMFSDLNFTFVVDPQFFSSRANSLESYHCKISFSTWSGVPKNDHTRLKISRARSETSSHFAKKPSIFGSSKRLTHSALSLVWPPFFFVFVDGRALDEFLD